VQQQEPGLEALGQEPGVLERPGRLRRQIRREKDLAKHGRLDIADGIMCMGRIRHLPVLDAGSVTS
jgi:hypothetical protein